MTECNLRASVRLYVQALQCRSRALLLSHSVGVSCRNLSIRASLHWVSMRGHTYQCWNYMYILWRWTHAKKLIQYYYIAGKTSLHQTRSPISCYYNTGNQPYHVINTLAITRLDSGDLPAADGSLTFDDETDAMFRSNNLGARPENNVSYVNIC